MACLQAPHIRDEDLADAVEVSLRQAQRYLHELAGVNYITICSHGRQREISINFDVLLGAPLRKAAFFHLTLGDLGGHPAMQISAAVPVQLSATLPVLARPAWRV